MRRILLGLCVLFFLNAHGQEIPLPEKMPQDHPRVLTTPEGKKETWKLIKKEAWAQDVFNKLKERTEVYTRRTESQPDWLLSRLAMYWKSHATEVYVKGEVFDHAGGAKAPAPTVRYTGTRGTAATHGRPKLEDVVPYDDSAEGNVTFCNNALKGRPLESVHPSKTGRNIESLNCEILGIARDAAFLYWMTGEEKYARLAAGVFDTYMTGIYYRNVPVDLNHGHQQTLVGLTSFEVIHEDALHIAVPLYDFLYDYLKANYPSEYMAAVMSRSLSNITDITKLMDECKAMGIQTLGPDVNESNLKFTVNHDGNIRFGLGAVKGVGEAAVQSIMEERKKNGPFLGIFDFVQRVNLNACNKKNMECLALAGGFDSFPELKREQYFAANSKGELFLETLMRYGNRYQADKAAAVNSLFGGENVIDVATPEIPQGVERWSDLDRLNRERDLVGIYLSAHPLDEFSIVLEHVCNTRMSELEDKAALAGREITMGGIVTSVRRGVSKNGNPYGIAKIEDYSGSTEIPFWGNDWVTYQGYLNEGTFLYIKARCQAKQWRQDELEIKITSMELLPDVKEELVQKITIIIPLSVLNTALVTELATLTKESPGNTELYFKVTDDSDTNHMSVDLISRPIKLSVGRDLITYLKERPELGFRIN